MFSKIIVVEFANSPVSIFFLFFFSGCGFLLNEWRSVAFWISQFGLSIFFLFLFIASMSFSLSNF